MRWRTSRPTRPYRRVAVFALVLFAAAVSAWLLLVSSEDNTTSAHTGADKSHFSAVSVFEDLMCAITHPDKKLKCWGDTWFHQDSPIGDYNNYESLRVGRASACAFRDTAPTTGIDPTNQPPFNHCWGAFPNWEPDGWNDTTNPIRLWDVSIDDNHSCWIVRDDSVAANDRKLKCKKAGFWRYVQPAAYENVPATIADYMFSDVTTGQYHACAIVYDSDRSTTAVKEDEGLVKCWGDTLSYAAYPPPATMTFKTIDSGDAHTCGIIKDSDTATAGLQDEDELYCWGLSHDRRLEAPKDITFKEVSSGSFFSCGIVKDADPATTLANLEENEDEIRCWGNNSFGQSDPAIGRYKSISASRGKTANYTHYDNRRFNGSSYACAITIDSDTSTPNVNDNEHNVACWGDMTAVSFTRWNNQSDSVVMTPFAGTYGDNTVGDPNLPAATATPTDSEVRDVIDGVFPGRNSTCILTAAGGVRCFGRDFYGEGDPPDNVRLDTISMGYGHACGLSHYGPYGKDPKNIDTNIICWGDDRWGQSTPPDGAFVSVAAGGAASCGVKADGTVHCWGKNLTTGVPTTSDYVDVKIGYHRYRDLWCYNYSGSVHHDCVRERGNDNYRDHACGLQSDGDVVCWGDRDKAGATDSGETAVPSGYTFKSIDAGQGTSCGIILTDASGNQEEDEAKCWGKSVAAPLSDWDIATTPTATPHPWNPPTATPTWEANSVDRYPHDFITPTPGTPKFEGPLTTHGLATCGIITAQYQKFEFGSFAINRSAGSAYCQGWNPAFGADQGVFFGMDIIQDYFGTAGGYASIATSGYVTCAVTEGGLIECVGQDDFGNTKPPRIATVKAGSAVDTYTCGTDTYNGASPIDGGRYPATDGTYYVSVPPAALENDKIVGIHMTEGTDATFTDRSTGHEFVGKIYTASVKDPTNAPNCTDPSPALSIQRPIDVCIPKPSDRSGRWQDWKLFEVSTGAITGTAIDGFTNLDGLICAEVKKLPITIAAASKPIPTPTPTPTPTATPDSHDHDGDHTDDLVYEKDFDEDAQNDVYIRVHAEELPLKQGLLTEREARLFSNRVTCDSQPSGPDNLPVGNVFKVGDQCYEINLKKLDGGDIGAFSTPAEICIKAPDGQAGSEVLYRLGEEQGAEWTALEIPDSSLIPAEYQSGYACGFAPELSWFYATAIGGQPATPTPVTGQRISRITPNVTKITLSAEDRVRLSVDVYGVQDILDNSLADDVTFEWSVEPSGGAFEEADYAADADASVNEREALFIAPSSPGRYTVKTWLDRFECRDDDNDDGCTAEFEVTVRRAAATPEPTVAPMNPAGEIPIFITDYDSNLYQVFTPEEGGNFEGDGVTVSADPGAVPNLEIIGVRAEVGDEASNVGQTKDRVTLAGNYYSIHAVDDSGRPLNGYLLDDPVTVCMPVPPRLASNISQLAMVSERADGTFAILSSNVRLSSESGVLICGALSELSARLAVGHLESPSALPTATPTPQVEEPDTGGNTPPISTSALMLLIILGTAITAMSVALLSRRKTS